MQISQVSNISFQGKFYSNSLIKNVLEDANDYELKRFSDTLQRMTKIQDNKNYILNTRTDFYTRTKELFLKDKLNGQFYKSIQTWDIKAKDISFVNCLEKINDFIETVYPQQKSTDIQRVELLKSIKNSLSE